MRKLVVISLILAGCAQTYPGDNVPISAEARAADFPKLDPLTTLLATARAPSDTKAQGDDLEARVARLKARAAALRGRDIFDGQERLKLLRATRR